jgi:NADH-quinone oxidoreductase subunit D
MIYIDLVKHWKALIEMIKCLNNNKPHLADTICLGGSIEIPNDTAFKALLMARKIFPRLFNQLYEVVYSDFVKEKSTGVGFISREDAYKFGFTGPVLRASGNIIDIRHTSPYLVYNFGEVSQKWNVISFSQGDIYARAQVRLWEIKESYSIIEYILKSLETYASSVEIAPITQDRKLLPVNEIAISKVESPHGELIYYFKTDPEKRTDKFDAVRIITPDMLNFYGLRYTGLLGQKLSSISNIIHSMDISFENVDL